MKYLITRTSRSYYEKPCNEAFEQEVILTDERTVNCPQMLVYSCQRETWFTDPKYFNHRVEKGHIKRDYKEKRWVIEFTNLKELMKFINKYTEVVIGKTFNCKEIPFEIEIYDDYRE